MQDELQHIHAYVYSEEMLALVKAANEAASYLEELKGKEAHEFISDVPSLLAAVYAAIIKVKETEPVYDAPAEPVVSEQDWAGVYQQIARILASQNEFLRPAEEGEFDRSELVTHTISEDLADVYQELRDFTSIYSRGMEELMNDAAWDLRERFAEHWGKKLLRTLLALHDVNVAAIDPNLE